MAGRDDAPGSGDHPGHSAADTELWRPRLLRGLLWVAVALATPVFPVIGWQALAGASPVGLSYLAAVYIALVFVAAVRGLPYTLRSVTLLFTLGSVAMLGFIRVGYQVGPGVGTALTVVLTGLLLGRRALAIVFVLTTIGIFAIGALQVESLGSHVAPAINDVTLYRNWVRVALVYALFTGVLATAVMFVVVHIERVLAERTRALEELRASQAGQRRAEVALDDAQRTIMQMQKMEAVGRLAGGVAHDFNNALVVILGWADLLRNRPADDTQLKAGLGEIIAASNRAAGLTQQLLTFARKGLVVPQPLAPAPLLTELVRMLERLLPENISLATHVAPGVPDLLADPTQMHQALLNLCLNARDAMPDGGRLELRAERSKAASVPGVPEGDWVTIQVRDTGVGMDNATQARVFEPFFTTKGEQGTGLGLASVYGIVQQSKGHVRVTSALGQGSTFTLYLPPSAGAATRKAESEVPVPGPNTATILVAEDEAAVRKMMVAVLTAAGHTVLAAANGTVALELARRHAGHIDLLCTDGVMPGISSAVLIENFRSLFPNAPIIVCSGHIEQSLQEQLKQSNLRYLNKPFTGQALVRVVANELGAQP